MQKYWRDRAFEIHSAIKAKGYRISRDMPAEIFPAFLTYYTRQQLLESDHGDDLMDLLKYKSATQPFVILDEKLGTKRIADLLNIKWAEARQLSGMFIDAFQAVAPGRVFSDDIDFANQVVLPQIVRTLVASSEFAAAFAAIGSPSIHVRTDHWDDTDEFHSNLPDTGASQRQPAMFQKPLREEKGDTWKFLGHFNLYPVDAAGNVIHEKFLSWAAVVIEFEKLDRAFIAPSEYVAQIYGNVSHYISAGGPFPTIDSPEVDIAIWF